MVQGGKLNKGYLVTSDTLRLFNLHCGVSFGADAANSRVIFLRVRGFHVSDESGVGDRLHAADEAEIRIGRARTTVRVSTHLTLDAAQI